MNTTSLPTQASVASWPSLNGAVSTQSSATSIVLAVAVQGESHSFLATARTWLRDLFTPPSTQDLERRCLPSVAFTPGGPLVYQWQIDLSIAPEVGHRQSSFFGQRERASRPGRSEGVAGN